MTVEAMISLLLGPNTSQGAHLVASLPELLER
jgi:hypothetical protein